MEFVAILQYHMPFSAIWIKMSPQGMWFKSQKVIKNEKANELQMGPIKSH